MELFKTTISFPILQFDNVAVSHTSPRFPTAFERVLLNICGQFANDGIYSEIPVKRIFEDILSVTNSDILLERTLDELVNIQAVQCSADYRNVETLQLKSLQLTDRGRQMFQAGMLQGIPQVQRETFIYDPIDDKLIPSKSLHTKRGLYYLYPQPFLNLFPDFLIRTEIDTQKKTTPWYSEQTTIENIERSGEPVVLWRNTSAVFHLRDGLLSVELPNEKYTEYLNQWDSETFMGTFLKDFLSEAEITNIISCEDFENLPQSNWQPVNNNMLTDAVLHQLLVQFNHEMVELNVAIKQ